MFTALAFAAALASFSTCPSSPPCATTTPPITTTPPPSHPHKAKEKEQKTSRDYLSMIDKDVSTIGAALVKNGKTSQIADHFAQISDSAAQATTCPDFVNKSNEERSKWVMALKGVGDAARLGGSAATANNAKDVQAALDAIKKFRAELGAAHKPAKKDAKKDA